MGYMGEYKKFDCQVKEVAKKGSVVFVRSGGEFLKRKITKKFMKNVENVNIFQLLKRYYYIEVINKL